MNEIPARLRPFIPLIIPPRTSEVRACVIAALVGLIFVVIASNSLFGRAGTSGFAASLVVGGTLTLLSMCGIIYLVKKKEPAKLELMSWGHYLPPINRDIDWLFTLTTLYGNQLFELLKKYPVSENSPQKDPWRRQDVRELADKCMKLSHELGCKMLEDLPDVVKKYPRQNNHLTPYVDAIASQKNPNYAFVVFRYCPQIYHLARSGLHRILDESQNEDVQNKFKTSQGNIAPFYQKESLENSWRELFNDYCDHFARYVSEEELACEPRHIPWIKKDMDSSFRANDQSLQFVGRPSVLFHDFSAPSL